MTAGVTLGQFLVNLAERPHAPTTPLWEGIDPTDPEVRRFMAGSVEAGFNPRAVGLAIDIARSVSYLEESDLARLRMKVARRAGIPYSEVVARWSNDDLAKEAATDILETVEKLERCSECGVAEWEVFDPDTHRWLDNGRWKIVEHACIWCRDLAASNEGLDKNAQRDKVRFVTRARLPGDDRIEVEGAPRLG